MNRLFSIFAPNKSGTLFSDLDRRGCLYDYLMYNLHLFLNE